MKMAAVLEFLEKEGYEQFKKAIYLTRESKNDPEDQPYKSLYEARGIFSNLKEKLNTLLKDNPDNHELSFAIAALELHLGINYNDTGEMSSGEEHLTRALKSVDEFILDDSAVCIFISTLNHLGILWSTRGQNDTAKEYLDRAESTYREYKQNRGNAPRLIDEFFQRKISDENELLRLRAKKFESIYTHTLYFAAQVVAKLGDRELSAKYCHTTLHRQLESHEYNPVEWALNAATLSQVYLSLDKFTLARHCLASASVIFQENYPNDESSNDDKLNWQYREADINRCWIKYALLLMETSKDEMMKQVETFDKDHNLQEPEDKSTSAKDEELADKHSEEEKEKEEKPFEPFNLEVTLYEEKVTDKLAKTFDDARNIFLFIQEKINSAKMIYTLNNHCSDYIELVQDHSKAFKHLAFFELDMERQCRMHKRRIDMLLAVLNELNPQHYLLVCRQLMYEIAETYSCMMDLKLSLVEMHGGPPTPHEIKKINLLAQQSITQYQSYLDSLKGNKPDYPEIFPDGSARPALIAMFCIGRLWGKIIPSEESSLLENISRSLNNYKFVVDYCKRHPEMGLEIEKEVSICEELCALLPAKMDKIRAGEAM